MFLETLRNVQAAKEESKNAEHDGDVRLQVLLREAESRADDLDSRVTQLETELATCVFNSSHVESKQSALD